MKINHLAARSKSPASRPHYIFNKQFILRVGLPSILLGFVQFQALPVFAQEGTAEPTPEPIVEELADEEPQATEEPVLVDTEPTPEPIAAPSIEPNPQLVSNPLLENDWSEPLNLSSTGSAGRPATLLDRNEILHIFWVDDFDGLLYMRKGDGWTQPVEVSTPFGTNTPQLKVDDNNRVHVFWIDEVGELLYSHVPADLVYDPSAWSGPVALGLDVVAFAAELDLSGQPHIAFHSARNSENQKAGIHYRTRPFETNRWSEPTTIYESPYMRLADQSNSQVSLAISSSSSAEPNAIFTAWANPGRDWVMMAQADSNTTWSEAEIIDQRAEEDDARTNPPSAPILYANGNQVVLSWNAGHGDFVCGRYFTQSNDAGETFSSAALSFGDLYECPRQSSLIPLSEDRAGFMMLTRTDELTYLSIWRDGEWEGRNIQPTLVQFREATTGRDIQLDCYRPAIAADRIMLVGCDRNIGQDVWFTEYLLADLITDITTERLREPVVVDDIDATPEAAPTEISAPIVPPEPTNNSLFGNENGFVSLALLFSGVLVVGFGVLTLFRRR